LIRSVTGDGLYLPCDCSFHGTCYGTKSSRRVRSCPARSWLNQTQVLDDLPAPNSGDKPVVSVGSTCRGIFAALATTVDSAPHVPHSNPTFITCENTGRLRPEYGGGRFDVPISSVRDKATRAHRSRESAASFRAVDRDTDRSFPS